MPAGGGDERRPATRAVCDRQRFGDRREERRSEAEAGEGETEDASTELSPLWGETAGRSPAEGGPRRPALFSVPTRKPPVASPPRPGSRPACSPQRGEISRSAALGLALLLAACATQPPRPVPYQPHAPQRPEHPEPPPAPPVPVASLPGWDQEDHAAALKAYQAACYVTEDPADHAACAAARALGDADEAAAKAFFETRFEARAYEGSGLLTGYFAPEYEARDAPDEEFSAPVRPKPAELSRGADGHYQPWHARAEIEKTPAQALAFMRPEDLFFMQIQGSGFLQYPDGRSLRAAYAADNGRPFTGIARPMVEQGLLGKTETSGENIRAWLAQHRGAEADSVTDLDQRYVFFALEPDDGGQPKGAAGVRLTAGRSAAVDPSQHGMGELLWIDAEAPVLSGAVPSYRRLVTALDAGGAVKGAVRVDLYLGRGQAAGTEAGRIRHPLRLWRLVPKGEQ